jgi:hypothetical protein
MGKAQSQRNTFLMKCQVKERGWTGTLIEKFLPDPDKTSVNPHYRSGPPIQLYSLARIVRMERTKRFREAIEKAAKCKEASKKAVKTKTAKMEEYLSSLTINVPELTLDELQRRALDHWRSIARDDWEGDGGSDWEDRIAVNYLRHEFTSYEKELEFIAGKVGRSDAYLRLFEIVLDAIADAYPHLMIECSRQIHRKQDRVHAQAMGREWRRF